MIRRSLLSKLMVATVMTAAVSFSLSTAAQAQIAAEIPTTATITVDNAFTLTQTDPLDFGLFAVVPNAGENGELIIAQNGTVTSPADGDSEIIPLNGQAPGLISISDAADTAVLAISHTIMNGGAMVCEDGDAAGCVIGSPGFELMDIDHPATVTVGAAGTASFNVGGTIQADGSAGPYLDTIYTAEYELTVSY